MQKFLKHFGLAVFAVWGCPVFAVTYTDIDAAQSTIQFTYSQMGVGMNGNFSKYGAKLQFDPARPEATQAVLDVQLSSVDAGYEEANKELAGKDWFDSATYPTARFEAVSVAAIAGDKYQLNGRLTIKGKTLDVKAPVSFSSKGRYGLFEGEFDFSRSAFSIGKGVWADPKIVGDKIQIRFKLYAIEK